MERRLYIKKFRIKETLFFIAILSIFSPITIYPVFFLLFSFFESFSLEINNKMKKILLVIVTFLFISTISFVINCEYSDLYHFFKIWCNFSFFFFGIHFVSFGFSKINLKNLNLLFEMIIIFTFIQVVVNVSSMNLWSMPLNGVKDSMDAYLITEMPVYFGIQGKNIWATKIALIEICYIIFQVYLLKNRNLLFWLFTVMCLFNVIYTFSRTAQVAFLLVLFFVMYWRIKDAIKNKLFIIVALSGFAFAGILILYYVYNNLLHLTLDSGDGLFARFELWLLFRESITINSIIYGNGILSGTYIIGSFTDQPVNNFHNVFLNTFNDIGCFGLITYLIFLYRSFAYDVKIHHRMKKIRTWLFFVPLVLIMNVQYLGYDNDIVIYILLFSLFQLRFVSKYKLELWS